MSYMGCPPKYVYNLDGILGRNQKVSSWYISEQIIPFSDILRIENRYDGTVYYGEPDPKRKFHIAMKTVEKYIRMTHVHVEVVRNSKNVVDVIVQDKNHKLCADSRLYAIFPICYTVISD